MRFDQNTILNLRTGAILAAASVALALYSGAVATKPEVPAVPAAAREGAAIQWSVADDAEPQGDVRIYY